MASFGKFLGGLLVGAVTGAAVMVFTTPRSGDEMRATLTNYWDTALQSGKDAAREREAQLWAEFNTRVHEQNGTEIQIRV